MLDDLNTALAQSLHQQAGETETKDGMDISLCAFDRKKKVLQFAGAFNPLYKIRDGEMEIIKADKFPVGRFVDEEPRKFTNNVIEVKPGDMYYICSDGFQDQFGGPKGKKFMLGKLKKLFMNLSELPIDEQPALLDQELIEWMGDEEQVDDVLVIGLKIS